MSDYEGYTRGELINSMYAMQEDMKILTDELLATHEELDILKPFVRQLMKYIPNQGVYGGQLSDMAKDAGILVNSGIVELADDGQEVGDIYWLVDWMKNDMDEIDWEVTL